MGLVGFRCGWDKNSCGSLASFLKRRPAVFRVFPIPGQRHQQGVTLVRKGARASECDAVADSSSCSGGGGSYSF